MPKVLKALGWIGMVAMLMVGGGIIMHNIDLLHFLSNIGLNLPYILPMVMTFFVSPVLLAVIIGSLIIFSISGAVLAIGYKN
jgi:predicted DNA repair protein MutK